MCAKRFFEQIVKLNKESFADVKIVILGPTPAKISKINNTFRYRLAIKCKNNSKIRQMITLTLKDIHKDKILSKVNIGISLNPPDIS